MAFSSKEKRREYEKEYIARADVKERRKAKFKEWRENNRARLRNAEAKRRLSKRGQCLIADARTRARRRVIIFDLDGFQKEIQARIDLGRCEITGVAFELSPGLHWNSPSLDRADPTLGYVYSNIRIVCHAINCAMGKWGEVTVWNMFKAWEENKRNGIVAQQAAEFIKAGWEALNGN